MADDTTPEDRAQAPSHTLDRSYRNGGAHIGFPTATEMNPRLRKWLEESTEDAPWNGIGEVHAITPRGFGETDGHSELSVRPDECLSQSSITYIDQLLCKMRSAPPICGSHLVAHANAASIPGLDQTGSRENRLAAKGKRSSAIKVATGR